MTRSAERNPFGAAEPNSPIAAHNADPCAWPRTAAGHRSGSAPGPARGPDRRIGARRRDTISAGLGGAYCPSSAEVAVDRGYLAVERGRDRVQHREQHGPRAWGTSLASASDVARARPSTADWRVQASYFEACNCEAICRASTGLPA